VPVFPGLSEPREPSLSTHSIRRAAQVLIHYFALTPSGRNLAQNTTSFSNYTVSLTRHNLMSSSRLNALQHKALPLSRLTMGDRVPLFPSPFSPCDESTFKDAFFMSTYITPVHPRAIKLLSSNSKLVNLCEWASCIITSIHPFLTQRARNSGRALCEERDQDHD